MIRFFAIMHAIDPDSGCLTSLHTYRRPSIVCCLSTEEGRAAVWLSPFGINPACIWFERHLPGNLGLSSAENLPYLFLDPQLTSWHPFLNPKSGVSEVESKMDLAESRLPLCGESPLSQATSDGVGFFV